MLQSIPQDLYTGSEIEVFREESLSWLKGVVTRPATSFNDSHVILKLDDSQNTSEEDLSVLKWRRVRSYDGYRLIVVNPLQGQIQAH